MQGKTVKNSKYRYYKQCPHCNTNKTESIHASVLKQVFLHEYPDTTLEDKSCINIKTNHTLPTDIVNHRLKIAIEIQSGFHDNPHQKEIDKFKRNFWLTNGYDFYDPDIRDYSILEMIKLFFPSINAIPDYIDYNFSNCIDFIPLQDLLNQGYTIKEVSEKTGIKKGTINNLVINRKLLLPDDYIKKVFKIKSVIRLSKDGEFIKRYETLMDIQRDGYELGTVRRVLNGKQKFSYNSFWVYEDDYVTGDYIIPEEDFDHFLLPVEKYDINNNFVCKYSSIYDAEKDSQSNRSEIYRVASGGRKSSRKEKWKFVA
jgi:hypothetical protein